MDNNVLRSPHFDDIVDEIKALGFQKGATYINPKTGKSVQRFVDFNQGLDAFLLTPHKAERLGELAIRPARIAFDHIEDAEASSARLGKYRRFNRRYFSNRLRKPATGSFAAEMDGRSARPFSLCKRETEKRK